MRNLVLGTMRFAIHFDDQLGRKNCKICDVRADRVLAAEVVTPLSQLAQMQPENDFGLGHLAAKCLGFRASRFFAFAQRSFPPTVSPSLRSHSPPPPQAGEDN